MEKNNEKGDGKGLLDFLKNRKKPAQNAVDIIEANPSVPQVENEEPVPDDTVTAAVSASSERIESYDFDPTELSPLTRYDFIELPSRGECYPSKKKTIPVRELTASDENLIASPNMYLNGQLIDTLLRRCILDKSFNVDDMCPGDRDAVVLWLRATAFGAEYHIKITNPDSGKQYDVDVNLAKLEYKDFPLHGDENGHFEYTFENGDIAKFRILSYKETQELQNGIATQYIGQKKFDIYRKISDIKASVDEIAKQGLADEPLNDAVDYILDWVSNHEVDMDEEKLYNDFVTRNLIERTVSINGNSDPQFVADYINSLRLKESKAYREYLFENLPGLDFSIEVPIPESDGGGSFASFLRYDDTIFFE